MKQRILFIIFSVLLIAGVAYQNAENRTLTCREGEWENCVGSMEWGILTAGEDMEGRILNSKKCLLDKGTYMVAVMYASSVPGSRVTAEVMGTTVMDVELPVSEGMTSMPVPLVLSQEGGGVSFHVEKAPGGVVSVQGFDITGEKPLNCDYLYLAVLMAILAVFLYYLLFLNRGRIGGETILAGLIITASAFFVSIPMFRPGIFEASDLLFCAFRIEGMKDALKTGQFPALLYPFALNGYGYPGGQLPGLFFYPAVFLRLFGVSLTASYKSLLFVINLGTGAIAYMSAKRLSGQNRRSALLFAVLYMTVFYRVSVLWNRSDLGELFGRAFLPLIAVGLYELLAGNRKKWWYLALGYGCLFQCHIPTLVIAALFSLFMGLCYIDVFFREKRWMELLKTMGCVLIFNAWYLIPFAAYIRSGLSLAGQDVDFCGGLLYVMDLFQLDLDKAALENQAGYPGLSVLFCAFFALSGMVMEGQRDCRRKYLSLLLAAGVCFALMATTFVPWQLFVQVKPVAQLTKLICYPRRFLEIGVPALLLAGTGWLSESGFLKKYAVYMGGLTVLAALVIVLSFVDRQAGSRSLLSADVMPAAVEQTGLLAGTDFGDLAPWPRVSDEEKVAVTDYSRRGKEATLHFSSEAESQFVEFPIFNYPGYRAFDQNGTRLPIETGTNNRIRVWVPSEGQDQVIHLKFTGKKIFWIGNLVTLAAVLWAVRGLLKRHGLVFGGRKLKADAGSEEM